MKFEMLKLKLEGGEFMNAIKIANKLVSVVASCLISLAIVFPLSARADYYLVEGSDAPMFCDSCEHTYYRPVYKHRVHYVKHHYHHHYYYPRTVRRSHYTITVYYPVPTYVETNPCTCCGGFIAPNYVWVPAPYRVYYTHPDDRLVGNSYEENDDPSVDTGTADNDVY